jgi:hypothetical protein
MEGLKRVANSFQCPNCNAFDGFSYGELRARCKKCNYLYDVFDLFEKMLTTMHDSELWSFPFAIISEFNLAPVFQHILSDDSIQLRPYEQVEIDFRKKGLPDNAKILYINITPYSQGDQPPSTLGFAYVRGHNILSISELPHIIRIVPVPPNNSADAWKDSSRFLNAGILIRWYLKGSNDVISDHLVRAAEGYWKDNLNDMIYYGFTAFEICLSNLVEDFWQLGFQFSEKEYGDFFGRDPIEKRMRLHVPLLCREVRNILFGRGA